jgi:Uroporphyrinogen decarboxylase (URO-D)
MQILRDQYIDYMTFGPVERPLFVELFGPLIGLDEEWRAQGASEDEINMTAFGFDYVRHHFVQVVPSLFPGFEEVVLEDTDEYMIKRDRFGRTSKLCKGVASISLPLDYPVTDMDSWLKIKPMYEFCEERFVEGWAEAARKARDEGALIALGLPGGFDQPRQLLGEEAICMAYYEQPEMMRDMLETMGNTAERIAEIVTKEVVVDHLSVHEDMAGKSGSLVGPRQIEEFISPYYHRVWDVLQSRGAKIFQQDSDGNMNSVIPAFLDAGLTCMYPMEPAAGMDIVDVRKAYGKKLAMLGGLDKHVLRKTKADILAELEHKLQPMMREGGMVFGLDHRIPPGTPLDNYRYYVRTAREILGLNPNPEPSWARMAF